MITDRNRIYDGWVSLEAGVDAGRNPATIAPNQCMSAENMTLRGGDSGVRPGFRKLVETFSNGEHRYLSNGVDAYDLHQQGDKAQDVYKQGVFQCAHGYTPHGGADCLMVMIGGRLFRVIPKLSSCVVTEITPIEDTSSPYTEQIITPPSTKHLAYRNKKDTPIAYMTQADKYMVVQDGLGKPIIYDGKKAKRSVLETDIDHTEIPVGTIMAYGMGRIVVVVNKRDIAFGDLYGSHDLPDPADSIILFTERNFLAEGFDSAIPFNQGIATGMAFFPQLDTSTGNGQLMVFAERGAASFFLSLPRELWKSSAFQVLALLTTGMRGHRSLAAVNEDLWFRAADGMRTYRQARSEPTEAGGWSHIPLSTNVRQYMDKDASWLLKYASTIYFDNRILTTVTPYWNQGRPYFNGVAVVDFDILSSFGTTQRPAWDGHWSKMAVTQLVTGEFKGVTRAFAFGIDADGYNQLYELSLSDKNDWDGQIPFELVSRSFDFTKSAGSNPFIENELYSGDIWIKDIQ